MALYYDAVNILTGDPERGSLKSRIYSGAADLKSKPAQVYALITESAKYDVFLKEVIDNAGLLVQKSKLTPLLSLLLVHDYLFSKGGIAASANHALRQSIGRHKARLQAEFTKARLRRKCASIEALKQKLASEKYTHGLRTEKQPRWVRVNRLKTTIGNLLENGLNGYKVVNNLSAVLTSRHDEKVLWLDPNIPDLLALSPSVNLTKSKAYADGEIILQDKASCFPAQLLLESNAVPGQSDSPDYGDIMDACAAPGNKTTHLASIAALHASLRPKSTKQNIFACERDPLRSKLLQKMVDNAGATNVAILPDQDFLALDGSHTRFANVTHLLLDPSCSGSGIVGREDIPELALPALPSRSKSRDQNHANSRKRKRNDESNYPTLKNDTAVTEEEYTHQLTDVARLEKLANLQTRILEHAFAFPVATRITYSTCSIHAEENEKVVARALQSPTALRRGWQLLPRLCQVDGLREWKHRGVKSPSAVTDNEKRLLSDEELDACIRCYSDDDEGTMGFFVCCFIREESDVIDVPNDVGGDDEGADDSWAGFSE